MFTSLSTTKWLYRNLKFIDNRLAVFLSVSYHIHLVVSRGNFKLFKISCYT